MPFSVVLDTCVLYPAHLRDTLLRLAERSLYEARWSTGIAVELSDNLIEVMPETSVDRLMAEMRRAFPEAFTTGYEPLIDTMTCDPKDRHVLAAAVHAKVAAVVTFNVSDFPASSAEPFEIDVLDPDTFLQDLLDLAPRVVIDELTEQADANRRAPQTLPELLDALARAGVPSFADEVRRRTV